MKIISLIFVAVLCCFSQVFAQGGSVDEAPLRMSLFEFTGGVQQPFGDMGALYGTNYNIGLGYAYKAKSNILLGANFSFLFGNNVNEPHNILVGLRTSSGGIVGPEGDFVTVLIQERGYIAGFSVGKIWPIFGPNPNSGLVAKFGVKYFEHRTWIETRQDDMPHMEGDYRKGYDRKRAGIATYQFVGYQHFSNNRYANFYVGFEIYQGFTTDYRTYNFDEMRYTDGDYLDILVGFKVAWVIPVYKQYTKEFFYN